MAKRYDWEAVESDYRTGRYTLQQLADMHGPNKATISRRAGKDGWEKDLSDAVRKRTREKVSRAQLDPVAQEALDKSDEELVEEAASLNAAIVHGHRRHLTRWRDISEKLAGTLEEMEVTASNYGDYARSLNQGIDALGKIVKLERQAYGIDDEDDEGEMTFAQLMEAAAPSEDELDEAG